MNIKYIADIKQKSATLIFEINLRIIAKSVIIYKCSQLNISLNQVTKPPIFVSRKKGGYKFVNNGNSSVFKEIIFNLAKLSNIRNRMSFKPIITPLMPLPFVIIKAVKSLKEPK